MANLSDLYQLDPTSGQNDSNSNFAGAAIGENVTAPSAINNALRALGSMTIRAIGYQSGAISSSASTNLVTASSGLVVPVLGANAIASFGIIPGEQPSAAIWRIVEFSSSASLSHGGSLFLTGGASRRTQPGDIGIYLHQGSGDRWKEVAFSRADGTLPMDSLSVTTITNRSMSTSAISTVTLNAASISATNQIFTNLNAVSASTSAINALTYYKSGVTTQSILQMLVSTSQASIADSINIPFDASAPLSTEGTQAFSVAVTPKNATSRIVVDVSLQLGGTWATGEEVIAALFKDTTCVATGFTEGLATNGGRFGFTYVESASSTTLRSYSVRFGAGTGDTYLNRGNPTTNNLGGTPISSIKITEVL